MRKRWIAGISAVATVFGIIVTVGMEVISTRIPRWFPVVLGSVGQTTTIYLYSLDFVATALMLGVAGLAGYYLGHAVDLDTEFGIFCQLVVAGAIGPLIAVIAVVGVWVLATAKSVSILLLVATVLQVCATVSLPVAVTVFAGAGFAYFRGQRGAAGEQPAVDDNEAEPTTSASTSRLNFDGDDTTDIE